MQIYLKAIASLNHANPAITSLTVWVKLCETFTLLNNPHSFYQSAVNYTGLAREFADCNPEQLGEADFFQQKIISFFGNRQIDPANEVTVMLRAFLICYPEHLRGIPETITSVFDARPYFLPVLLSDLNKVVSQKKTFLISSAERFTTNQLSEVLASINEQSINKKRERQIYTAQLLGILWKRYKNVDFGMIAPLTITALSFVRHSHYTTGTECTNSDCAEHFSPFVDKHLLEILNQDTLDLNPLLNCILDNFSNASESHKKACIRTLRKIIFHASTHHICILTTLRSLMSTADDIYKCEIISLISKVSNDTIELTAHLPLLFSFLKHQNLSVKYWALSALKLVKKKILLLAEQSSKDRESIIYRLLSILPGAQFTPTCTILQLLAKIADVIPELENGLLNLLNKLPGSVTRTKKTLIIETLTVLCETVTAKIPNVVSALLTEMSSPTSKVRVKALNAMARLAGNTNADLSGTLTTLLHLITDADCQISNSAINALGQVMISNNPLVPMADLLPTMATLITNTTAYDDELELIDFIGGIANHRSADYTDVFNAIWLKMLSRIPEDAAETPRNDFTFIAHITALGKLANQASADMSAVIKLLVNRLQNHDNETNKTITTALLKIAEMPSNHDLVIYALLNKINHIEVVQAHFLVDIVTTLSDTSTNVNFDKLIHSAKDSLDNTAIDKEATFALLKALSKNPYIDIEKIIDILIIAMKSSFPETRKAALKLLEKLDSPLTENNYCKIIEIFRLGLKDNDNDVRSEACYRFRFLKLKSLPPVQVDNEDQLISEFQREIKSDKISESSTADAKPETDIAVNNKHKRKFMQFDSKHILTKDYPSSGINRGIVTRLQDTQFHHGGWRARSRSCSPLNKRAKTSHPIDNKAENFCFKSIEAARLSVLEEALSSNYSDVKEMAMQVISKNTLVPVTTKTSIINEYIKLLQNCNSNTDGWLAINNLTEIVKQDSQYAEPILESFVEKLARDGDCGMLIYRIIELAESKLNSQQQNYLIYGLLLHKLHITQNQEMRFNLLMIIDKLCRVREMDYHVATHLKESFVVTLVRQYTGFSMLAMCT
jgi:HEAT repeat protein